MDWKLSSGQSKGPHSLPGATHTHQDRVTEHTLFCIETPFGQKGLGLISRCFGYSNSLHITLWPCHLCDIIRVPIFFLLSGRMVTNSKTCNLGLTRTQYYPQLGKGSLTGLVQMPILVKRIPCPPPPHRHHLPQKERMINREKKTKKKKKRERS